VFNLYARDTYDAATSAAIRENVITSMIQNRRFHKFREFEQIVQDVYSTAGSPPCIPNLYGEILQSAATIK
jgi:hypothetical protein